MLEFISSFFGGLWSKVAVIGAAAISFLLLLINLKNDRIEELEEEQEARNTVDEINDDMRLATVKSKEKADEDIKDIDDSDWRSGI